MKFLVDRQRWLRGRGQGLLLTKTGFRCCIGFVGVQCSIPDARMRCHSCVSEIELPKWPGWLQISVNAAVAYSINDDPEITDDEREAKLKKLFIEHGDEIDFIN